MVCGMKNTHLAKKTIGFITALTFALSAVCFNSYASDSYDQNSDITDSKTDSVTHLVRVGLNYSSSALDNLILECSDGGFSIFIDEYSDEPEEIDVTALELESDDGMLYVRTIFGSDAAAVPENTIISIYPANPEEIISIDGTPYRGGFEFYSDNGKITVINVLDIEDYIKGVLPSEVYTSWNIEALKAAAVVSRTYALKNSGASSHSSLGFDICATTHCQMYSGVKKENERTNTAISETQGLVVKYNGVLAMTPYHSSTGGYTESAADAWGSAPSDYPYLTEIFNPYEDYLNVPNGKWENIISTEELFDYIPSSYSANLENTELSFDYDTSSLGFIGKMTVSDAFGNSVSMKTSSAVRSFFGSLVKSANFMIAQTYIPSENSFEPVTVISADGIYDETGLGGYEYITADGIQKASGFEKVYVFDGMGYGHGVGMSQFGARDMANAGFTYEEILQTYFPGTEIEPLID